MMLWSEDTHPLVVASVFALGTSVVLAMGAKPKADEEAVNARIAPVARVVLAPAAPKVAAGNRSGEELYKAVCSACHEAGVAGAPKTGDAAAWAPRIKTGLDALLATAIKGLNAMPPRGGAADATDDELRRAIVFMTNKSGASFKE